MVVNTDPRETLTTSPRTRRPLMLADTFWPGFSLVFMLLSLLLPPVSTSAETLEHINGIIDDFADVLLFTFGSNDNRLGLRLSLPHD